MELGIAELAERQQGVVSRAQLLNIGLDADAIDYRVEVRRLHPLHAGVYAVGHRRVSRRGEWWAAVLACGPGGMLSHWSGAALWGLLRARSGPVHVTAPGRRRNVQPGIAVHRPRRLQPADCAVRDGMPVTSIPRTLLDLAGVGGQQALNRAAEEADRLGLLEVRSLERTRRRCRGHRGVRKLDVLLAELREPPDVRSELERRFLELCEDHGIPLPATNVRVADHTVDCNWPAARLVVELDGWRFHRSRQAWERDHARDAALRMAGVEVHRITYRRLSAEPELVAAEVRELLIRRGHPSRAPTYNAPTPPA